MKPSRQQNCRMRPLMALCLSAILVAPALAAKQTRRKVTPQMDSQSNFPLPSYCPPNGGGIPFPSSVSLSLDTDLGVGIPVLLLSTLPFIPAGFEPAVYAFSALINAAWTAIVPFHKTAKPSVPFQFTRQSSVNPKKDMNIAVAYATLGVAQVVSLEMAESVKSALKALGLDPATSCTASSNTPGCIGLRAATATIRHLDSRGWNREGDIDHEFNGSPLADYNYVNWNNTPYELKNIYGWQPQIETNGKGLFWVQLPIGLSVANLKGLVFSRSYIDQQSVPYKRPSMAKYKAEADAVLEASAQLTDEKKVLAESLLFAKGLAFPAAIYYADKLKWDLPTFLAFNHYQSLQHDIAIIVFKEKNRYHTVRPTSAIRYLYGDKKVRAYAVSEKAVKNIAGNEWLPYLPVPSDYEYPSGATCLCTAYSEWLELFLGTKKINLPYRYPKGCSVREPGVSPAADVVGEHPTTTDLLENCRLARVWAGAHFPASTIAARGLCTGKAKKAYEWLNKLWGK